MRKNTTYLVLLVICLLWTEFAFSQFTFTPGDTTWRNNDGQPYPWRMRPRTGYTDTNVLRIPQDPNPMNNPSTRTRYYIDNNLPGYLEFLPQGYDDPANASKTYPLLLFLPGCGEIHHGVFYLHTNGAPNTNLGLGRLFSSFGSFPAVPTICRDYGGYMSGVPFKTPGVPYNYNTGPRQGFIVMNLMYRGYPSLCSGVLKPSVSSMDSAILLAKSLYRVDPQRIYFTGMSQGGEQSWDFPSSATINKLAAAVPVCSYGQIVSTTERAQQIVNNQTHILSITNLYDYNTNGTGVDVITQTETAVNTINAYPGGSAYLTVLHFLYKDPAQTTPSPTNQPDGLDKTGVLAAGVQNHDAWNRAYPTRFGNDLVGLPVYTDPVTGDGFTLYEWMLLHRNNLVVLPVNVASFTATRNNNGVELVWVTSTESNSKEFMIERSEDGNNYQLLQTLPAAGNSSTNKRYAFEDIQVPNVNFVYYRLSQKDRDGALKVIGVKKVFIGVKGFAAKLYPTVASSKVMVDLQQVFSTSMGMRVSDASGRVLMQRNIPARTPRMEVDISALARGVYFVELNNEGYRTTLKFFKD